MASHLASANLVEQHSQPQQHPQADSRIALRPDVILVRVADGSARLLDMRRQFYAVSASGRIFLEQALLHGTSAAVTAVARRFNADIEKVRRDFNGFLNELEKRHLISRGEKRQGGHCRPAQWCCQILVTGLAIVVAGASSMNAQAWALLLLARLCLRLFGWSTTLTAWRRCFPMRGGRARGAAGTIDEAVRHAAANHVLIMECKERALSCWALLRSAGFRADFVVGISPFPLAGHCWCEIDRQILSDDDERCRLFTPVILYS